jgi:hypothetical protein
MRVTNLIRNPAFMDYIILGRYEQPLTLALHERKLIVQIIPSKTAPDPGHPRCDRDRSAST